MRIEILIGSEDPIIYPLNNPKITIGSADSNDIVLTTSGVSRKHVMISNENEVFFITDQGSTNGTFINEERLVPGKRVEFTSFFPVRLGDNVLLTLLSDEEATSDRIVFPVKEKSSSRIENPFKADATTTINLKDLNKTGATQKLVLESKSKRASRKKATPVSPVKKKSKINFVQVFGIALIGAAAYYTIFLREESVSDTQIAKVGEVKVISNVPEKKVSTNLIDKDLMPSREKAKSLFNDLKCITEAEKYICEIMPKSSGQWGATQVGTILNIMVDGSYKYNEADRYFSQNKNDEVISKLAGALYLLNTVPKDLDISKIGELNLNFILFKDVNGSQEPFIQIGIKPASLKLYQQNVKPENFLTVPRDGEKGLEFTQEYYLTN